MTHANIKGKVTGEVHTTTVAGKVYEVYSDFCMRATYAVDTETGVEKAIRQNGYIHNDLTIRKAIATAFNLATFRK